MASQFSEANKAFLEATHNPFQAIAENIVLALEAIGVFVIVVGIILAILSFITSRGQGYNQFRQDVGHGILLGLEFLVAADIIATVTDPSIRGLIRLGGIVLIRTFLSITLRREIEGRRPWL